MVRGYVEDLCSYDSFDKHEDAHTKCIILENKLVVYT